MISIARFFALTGLAGSLVLGTLSSASAAPHADSRPECTFVMDLLLTTRAMVEAGMTEETISDVLGRMYEPTHLAKWRADIIQHAQRAKKNARDEAQLFYGYCVGGKGNVDGLLDPGLARRPA